MYLSAPIAAPKTRKSSAARPRLTGPKGGRNPLAINTARIQGAVFTGPRRPKATTKQLLAKSFFKSWAGNQYGGIAIPRILAWNVLISPFSSGDPGPTPGHRRLITRPNPAAILKLTGTQKPKRFKNPEHPRPRWRRRWATTSYRIERQERRRANLHCHAQCDLPDENIGKRQKIRVWAYERHDGC